MAGIRKSMFGPLPKSRNFPIDEFIYRPPASRKLEILYEDPILLVLNKPSGLLSVPGNSPLLMDSLEHRVQQIYPQARTVHRLDRETSGVVVMALNSESHRHISLQFERRKVRKVYLARVAGCPAALAGSIDLPLCTDWPNRPKQMVERMLGRSAVTHWKRLSSDGHSSLMELHPVTGRSHQLRVHMLEIGHPILGDSFYAPPEVRALSERLLLHAHKIAFHHPQDGRQVEFASDCDFSENPVS